MILSDADCEALIMSLAKSRGCASGLTEDEAERLLELAAADVIGGLMVNMAIDGKLLVDLKDGELVYSKPEQK